MYIGTQTTLNGQQTWRCLCPIWMFTKGCSEQRKILMIKWIEWPLVWILCLFPQHCLSLPNGLTISGYGSSGDDDTWAELHEIALTRPTWIQTPLSAQSASSRYTLSSQYGTIPQDAQPAICLHRGRGPCFLLTIIDTLDIELLSQWAIFLPKLPSMDL